MIIEADNVKGFQDFLPPISLKRAEVKKIIEKYFILYGFLPIETPIIEFDELMKPEALPSEQEDESVSDRFRLKDRGGRNLGLRYEFTFQLARIFKQNPNIKLPFRRYQIGEVFRDEPTGASRFRQFTQCDIDVIGDSSVKCEAEILEMVFMLLKELKIECEIHVNNRKLLNDIIESVEMQNKKQVMRELDKIDKIGEDAVKNALLKFGDSNQVLTLFKMLGKDITFFKANAFNGVSEIEELIERSKKAGVKVKFSPFMIRGLGYYTGNIFEVKFEKNTIAAGGRYDKSVGKYLNKEIPAVGISFGLERVTELSGIKASSPIKVVVVSIGQDSSSSKLLRKIRNSGTSSLMFSDSVSKALEYANSYQIPYAIFVGEDEIKKKKLKLRDLNSGEEKYLTEKQLIAFLEKSN